MAYILQSIINNQFEHDVGKLLAKVNNWQHTYAVSARVGVARFDSMCSIDGALENINAIKMYTGMYNVFVYQIKIPKQNINY